MRRTKRSGSFLLCLLINLLLNLEWSIPAWVLLGLHIWLDISIWWFVGAVGLWILSILTGMCLMGWAVSCGVGPYTYTRYWWDYNPKTGQEEWMSFYKGPSYVAETNRWADYEIRVVAEDSKGNATKASVLIKIIERIA